MSVALSPIGNAAQFFSNAGLPLIGGRLYTYAAGTSTPTATFTDSTGTVQNANPIVFLASGRLANEIWLTVGTAYKFELRDALGNLIATYDNITGIPAQANIASFLDFGALGNNSFDNTTAYQAAFDSGLSLLYCPDGIYRMGAVSITAAMRVLGGGAGKSIIRASSATGDLWNISHADTFINGIQFDTAVTRTSGALVHYAVGGDRGNLSDFTMFGAYLGVQITAGATVRVSHGSIRDGATTAGSAGILVDAGNDHYITQITMDNPAGSQTKAGIQITSSGCTNITDCDIIHCTSNLLINPGNGQTVACTYLTESYFDTATRGIHIAPTGTGAVVRFRAVGCWTGSNTSQGVFIDTTGGTKEGFEFIGHHAESNGTHGYEINGGNNFSVIGGLAAGNTTDGIRIGANVSNWSIQGTTSGAGGGIGNNGGFGLKIIAGTTNNYRILGNDFSFNTGGAVSNAGSGAIHFILNNTGYVTQNKGQATIPNGATSVAVTHNLAVTPNVGEIMLTALTTSTVPAGTIYYDTIGATQFTIRCAVDPGASGLVVGWQATCF